MVAWCHDPHSNWCPKRMVRDTSDTHSVNRRFLYVTTPRPSYAMSMSVQSRDRDPFHFQISKAESPKGSAFNLGIDSVG
jgi:hypothetical protein